MLYFSRSEQVVLILLIALLLVGGGLLIYGKTRSSSVDEPLLSEPPKPHQPRQLVVHVAGQVRKPGVYQVAPGTRVEEAITQAGGCTSQADTDAINLAAKVEDGEKIYVPSKQEAALSGSIPGGGKSGKSHPGPKPLPKGPIAINSATAAQLQQLPGIGPVYAQQIIQYRSQLPNQKFTSIEELMNVTGIGPKRFAQIKPYVKL